MKLFSKLRATWLYRRGMTRAKLHQHALAVEDYTAVIDMDVAPAGIKAMALYNRALVHYVIGDASKSIEDLKTVLVMAGAADQVRVEARRKLVRMERTLHRTDARQQGLQAGEDVAEKPNTPGEHS